VNIVTDLFDSQKSHAIFKEVHYRDGQGTEMRSLAPSIHIDFCILRLTLKTIRGTHVCCHLQYVIIFILVRHTA